MKIILCLCLLLSFTALADDKKKRFEDSDLATLQNAKSVFVEKAEKDADVAIIEELNKWGKWKIAADQSEADLIIRLRASGSGAWGVGHVQAFILDPKTKKTLYTSNTQKGTRTIFKGYASPFRRAADGIVKQMKKDIK